MTDSATNHDTTDMSCLRGEGARSTRDASSSLAIQLAQSEKSVGSCYLGRMGRGHFQHFLIELFL